MSSSSNALEIAALLEAAGNRVQVKAVGVTHHYGLIMQARARANASGRPGPRAQTGDFRRSLVEQTTITAEGGVSTTVGSSNPQAWRLEKGFTGVDAIGREYDQPPYPSLEPAYEQTAPEYQAALAALVTL